MYKKTIFYTSFFQIKIELLFEKLESINIEKKFSNRVIGTIDIGQSGSRILRVNTSLVQEEVAEDLEGDLNWPVAAYLFHDLVARLRSQEVARPRVEQRLGEHTAVRGTHDLGRVGVDAAFGRHAARATLERIAFLVDQAADYFSVKVLVGALQKFPGHIYRGRRCV